WKIADGYYLYRHRISVEVAGPGFEAGALDLPHGDPHTDEFFGEVETFRHALRATLPGHASAGAGPIHLKVKYQGCADIGVCYPPQTRTLSVALPVADAGVAGGLPTLGAPRAGGLRLPGLAPTAGVGDPLPEDQAYRFEAIVGDANTLLLPFTPAAGYYLYRDRTRRPRTMLTASKGSSPTRTRSCCAPPRPRATTCTATVPASASKARRASPSARRTGRRARTTTTNTSATWSCTSTRWTCRCRCGARGATRPTSAWWRPSRAARPAASAIPR